jgi:predicted transcriptional regulator
MNKTKIKESVKQLLDKLPDDSKYEDIIAEIYFKQHIEEGLMQLDEGKGISHDEVKKRLEKWLK